MTTEIYLDGNATSAVLPSAITAAAVAMSELYGNPSSTHATGLKAKDMMSTVRARARRLLGVGSGRLMFNSGATEGIQTAILSALVALRERRVAGEPIGNCLVYGETEHKAVPESLAHWNRLLGLNLVIKPLCVDGDGMHDLLQLQMLAPNAGLVCTMAANNETGVISDLAAIESVLAETGSAAYWLVDCVQALGKLHLDLAGTRIDYAPFSGHKLYAPKGIGMLYVRDAAPFTPLMIGGGQETGQRSGTENMAGIAALGEVLCALEDGTRFRSLAEMETFRERLAASLRSALPGVVFNAPFNMSLPTTLNFSVPWLSSKELLDLFDAANVRVSSGSACSSAKSAPSYVLEAMHLPTWRCAAAIRMSFGPLATVADIDAACARLERCGTALQESCMTPSGHGASSGSAVDKGPVQFSLGEFNTWLVADSDSGTCVIIDPQESLAPRIENYVRCQQLQVRAVVHTRTTASESTPVVSIALGAQILTGVRHDDGHMIYLLADGNGASPVPRFAFTGAIAVSAIEPVLLGDATLLCPGIDAPQHICTTRAAERNLRQHDALGNIAPAQLTQFLEEHPEALLIDVREHYEHAAGGAGSGGVQVLSVPLSELTGRIEQWLSMPHVPLVFFCRSGNRSARAAACLCRLGHHAAWSVAGGMAMAGVVLQRRSQAS